MHYGTSIPLLMRKKKITYQEALRLIQSLMDDNILIQDSNPHIQGNEEFILTFQVESKYGRNLFYPICDNAKFIIQHLLFQKTATKNQINTMQNHGWEIKLKRKDIF